MRLANFPGSPLSKHPWRTRSYGTLVCPFCGRTARKKCATQIQCGRLKCKREQDRQRWRRKRQEYLSGSDRANHQALGPMREALPAPHCTCGTPLRFGSDSFTGASLEYCPTCNVERPLAIHGERRQDQRAVLEVELSESVERAHTLVKNPRRPEHCGDAFRQQAHKKGTCEFLGKKAVA